MFRQGVLLMLLSALLFAGMSTTVRGLTAVNAYTIAMVRFVIGALAVAALFACGLDRVRWGNWAWIVARGVTGGISVALGYSAIQHVGLARSALLLYTYVVFAALFAVPILGERMRLSQWTAIAVAMAGVAMMCGTRSLTVFRGGDLMALASGVLSGFAVVSIARCRETDSAANIFWSQCLFGIAIVAWPTVEQWVRPAPSHWALLVLIGVLAAAGQITMTHAYKFTGATYGSLLSLLTPVTTATIGILGFHEPASPGLFLGGTLVLLACVYLSLDPVEQRPAEALAGAASD
ncbi:MAG: DMT family transporter [Armatimonadetes bacterium]|nr:DMT family transporter [Armatimonadota bacterium]